MRSREKSKDILRGLKIKTQQPKTGHSEISPKRKFTAIEVYLKKQEKSQTT